VLPHAEEVHKISIVARGSALGFTVMLPEEDRHLHTRSDLSDRLAMTLGGRTAEEVVFGEITTGAVDDIEQATRLARAMVTEFGMSDKLGPQRFTTRDGEPFLGREHASRADVSDDLAARIDDEVSRLLDEAHVRARDIVQTHRATLDALADALIERETLLDEDLALGNALARREQDAAYQLGGGCRQGHGLAALCDAKQFEPLGEDPADRADKRNLRDLAARAAGTAGTTGTAGSAALGRLAGGQDLQSARHQHEEYDTDCEDEEEVPPEHVRKNSGAPTNLGASAKYRNAT
jgi:hypothetical protein